MSFAEILATPQVLLAVLFFTMVGAGEPFVEHRLNAAFEGNHAFHWMWEHFFAPLLRAATLVAFVWLAYPAIFGMQYAPAFEALLGDDTLRLNTLLGLLFLCTLLLPLFPLFARRVELVLPLQGLIATAAVFDWYTGYLGATAASIWPGMLPAALLLAIIVFGHRIAARVGQHAGHTLDERFATRGFERIVPNAIELLAQAPVMLLYGFALGRQIAI